MEREGEEGEGRRLRLAGSDEVKGDSWNRRKRRQIDKSNGEASSGLEGVKGTGRERNRKNDSPPNNYTD